jgi:uncharacterized SAM-binding protein YcdF (DUF218 family)
MTTWAHPVPSAARRSGSRRRWVLASVSIVLIVAAVLYWGGSFLVVTTALPAHAQAAVVLQGSIVGEKARLDGALQLAAQGRVDRVLVSVPRESYWGQSIPPVARQFIERNYGAALADRVDFCETGAGVDSTQQEAAVVIPCIQQQGWNSIVVVTSNYHTRRAGRIWREQMRKEDPATTTSIYGVPDPEFQPKGWWRERRSAKTWFFETTKLIWAWFGG